MDDVFFLVIAIHRYPRNQALKKETQEHITSSQSKQDEKTISSNVKALELVSSIVKDIKEKEEKITTNLHAQIRDIQEDKAKTITNLQIKINNLVQEVATKDLIIDFERLYIGIFGSQITLLESLQNSPAGLGGILGISSFWWTVQKNNPTLSNWSLENYLNFLIQSQLIEGNAATGIYKITTKGQAFLTYITNRKYEKNKGL